MVIIVVFSIATTGVLPRSDRITSAAGGYVDPSETGWRPSECPGGLTKIYPGDNTNGIGTFSTTDSIWRITTATPVNNRIIKCMEVFGEVRPNAPDVIITDSIIHGRGPTLVALQQGSQFAVNIYPDGVAPFAQNITVTHSTIVPDPATAPGSVYFGNGVGGWNFTASYLDVSGFVDGIDFYGGTNNVANATIENNWIHDLAWYCVDPGQANSPFDKSTHNDGIQTTRGKNVTISGNYIDTTLSNTFGDYLGIGVGNNNTGDSFCPSRHVNAAFMIAPDSQSVGNLTIENNYMDHADISIHLNPKQRSPMFNIVIRDNTIGHHQTNPTVAHTIFVIVSPGTQMSLSNNRWEADGVSPNSGQVVGILPSGP
jgi:hypothetical protein